MNQQATQQENTVYPDMKKGSRGIGSWLAGCACLLQLWLFSMPAAAIIEIEITKGGANAIPIAVTQFGWEADGSAPEDVGQIVSDDLQRSGLFSPLERSELIANPVYGQTPNYANWRLSGVDYLVTGGIRKSGKGYKVDFELFDPIREKILAAKTFTITNQTLRNAAHLIADEVFEEVIGIQGAFNTQIAYISVAGSGTKKQYKLQLADADGRAPQAMLTSPRPIMSPAWAPDGVRIAYVSFEDRARSAIYIQDRKTGKRTKVISREGINGAPSWSPDGKKLAIVLSYGGNPDVYVVDIASGKTSPVTQNEAIDTGPEWIDNSTLVFTSNRSGGPQLYEVSSSGGKAVRLTYEGRYNTNASVSPDGQSVAFVHGSNGRYQIALIDRDSGSFRTLTDGSLDESPSFAPNGQMILFATNTNGRATLGAVSVDGDVVQSLTLDTAGVREPAWSPYTTQ